MKSIREKRHHLDSEIYKGERPITFTLCLKNRKQFFINKTEFLVFERILLSELKNFNCSAFVYLFMPDHAHFVLSGNKEDSDIKKCLDKF